MPVAVKEGKEKEKKEKSTHEPHSKNLNRKTSYTSYILYIPSLGRSVDAVPFLFNFFILACQQRGLSI